MILLVICTKLKPKGENPTSIDPIFIKILMFLFILDFFSWIWCLVLFLKHFLEVLFLLITEFWVLLQFLFQGSALLPYPDPYSAHTLALFW